MKQTLTALAMVLTVVVSHLVTSPTVRNPASENGMAYGKYEFLFKHPNGSTFDKAIQAASEKEAFEQASADCLSHYYGQARVKPTEDDKKDLIDTCANPKRL